MRWYWLKRGRPVPETGTKSNTRFTASRSFFEYAPPKLRVSARSSVGRFQVTSTPALST